jgi:hypothetical protein
MEVPAEKRRSPAVDAPSNHRATVSSLVTIDSSRKPSEIGLRRARCMTAPKENPEGGPVFPCRLRYGRKLVSENVAIASRCVDDPGRIGRNGPGWSRLAAQQMGMRLRRDRRCRADLGGTKAGREIGYCHLEKLHNLEALPAHGFTISCFPVKIRGASAGWTRAVAILDE